MATDTNYFSFPRTDIPKKEKENEEYHKNFGLAIINESIGTSYDLQYAAMDESVTFFNGDQGGDEFNFLQSAADGETLPATWINFNRIRSRFEILFGELQSRGYQIQATSINKDATTRKLKKKEQARVNMNMSPARESLEGEFGLPLTPEGFVPKDEQELDSFFNYNYKEQNEIIMEYALRYLAKKHGWSYTRLAAFRDLIIMGRSFYMVDMKDGTPFIRRIDPRYMIFDANATDDFLSDATYFGEVRYMSLADAAARYELKEEEIKDVYGRYEQYQKTSHGSHSLVHSRFTSLNGSTLQHFKGEGNDLRVLVVSAMWQDQETIKHREGTDSHGGEHLKEVSDTATSGKLITNTIAQWRKCTIIGGDLVKEWGIMENSARENDSLAETSAPIKALLPNYLNGRTVSKVDQIKGLQKLKDLALYNVQLEMSTAGRKGFIYDVAQSPDGWDIHTVMKYLKTAGIGFIDSQKSGIGATHNQFQAIDQTLGKSVEQYINISALMDQQMDAITGINDARQGQMQGANQGLGVTQSALMQSNMTTKMYEDLFRQLNERALNYQAALVKTSFAGNEKYAPIIGDVGVDFLAEEIDLSLDDFGVFIEEIPPLLDDLNSFREIVTAALHSGAIDFVTAARLLSEKDVITGIDRLEAVQAQNKQEAQAAQEAQMQQMQQAEQQRMQGEHQSKVGVASTQGDYDLKEQQLENQGKMEQIAAKGKIDAGTQGVDVTKDMMLARLKDNAEARKNSIVKK